MNVTDSAKSDSTKIADSKVKSEVVKAADQPEQGGVVLVDLGKQSRKRLKRLRRGEGRLMDEVAETMRRLREAGEIDANATPVVFIAREKEDRLTLPWVN
jgi:uncharacterized protein DUF6200